MITETYIKRSAVREIATIEGLTIHVRTPDNVPGYYEGFPVKEGSDEGF